MAENDELGHGEVFPGFSCSTEQLFEATSKSSDLVVVLHPDNVVYTEVVNPSDVFWEEIEGLSRDEAIEYMLNDRVEDLWANSPLAEHGEF